jgi:voltage-gated potassium channel
MVTTGIDVQTPAYHAWNRAMEWPLMGVAVLFGVTYAYQVLAQPQGGTLIASQLVSLACWLVFAVDYVVRLKLATDRRHWFFRNLLSLLVVSLPILRPLRLVRLLTLFTVFQRAAGTALRGRVVTFAAATTTLLIFVASLAVFDAERYAPGADITTYGDAIWWACVTITTVGYGDLYPVTVEGRCIAVGMMVCGIALLGTVTATIASWLVERVAEAEELGQAATQAQMKGLSNQVDRLEHLLIAATSGPESSGPGTPDSRPRLGQPRDNASGEIVT